MTQGQMTLANQTETANSRSPASGCYVAGVKIERHVPMPEYTRGKYMRRGKWQRVFGAMLKGDSFTVPLRTLNTLRNCARKLGVRIIIEHQEKTTWRIWKAT